ncbi:Translation_initiation inhibitor [Hexamita inflata]|uniref:Translation initiation inhibitor n=1 Tax=Hexamita inflata TaxID=28002 RepID=A0AA86QA46_9EUKA|nr:Translation initiation inhibitor [Hexamita inflata]
MPLEPVIVQDSPCLGPYSHAMKANGFLFVSGQLGMVGGQLPHTVEEQTDACLKNLGNVLKAAGSDYNKVVKCQVMLKDMNDFAKVNEVYAKYFVQNKPARICVEVARLPKDALVEIDAIAAE